MAMRQGITALVARWRTATLLIAAATLWIAMAEIDRLIAGTVSTNGENSSMAILSGFGSWGARDTWRIWSSLGNVEHGNLVILATLHVVLDVFLAALYGYLLFRLARGAKALRTVAVLAALTDIAEGFLTIGAVRDPDRGAPVVAAVLGTTANIKWLLLGFFLIGAVAVPAVRNRMVGRAVRIARVAQFHRLTVTAVALVAILALLPIPGVNDQMPDSQRLWAEGDAQPLIASSVVVPLLAVGLQYIGRLRSVLAWELWARSFTQELPPRWRLWLAGPLILAAGIVLMVFLGPVERTNWWQFGIFVTVPLCLLAISMVLKAASVLMSPWAFRRKWVMEKHPQDRRRALDIWRGGDYLATLLIAVAGMALVRSFAGPVAMLLLTQRTGASTMPPGWPVNAVLLLSFGAVLACGVFPVRCLLFRRLPRWFGPDPRRGFGQRPHLKLLVLFVGAVPLLLLLVVPSFPTAILGVSATAVLGLGSWALLFGAVVVWAQQRQPLEIFQRMGLRANPILSLMVAALALGQISGGAGETMHLPRTSAVPATVTRNSLADEFTSWLRASAVCDMNPGHGKTARPMLVVASEGGGIRAASWTTRAFGSIAESPCGKAATLLSSGVSGGSLGLALVTRYGSRTGSTEMTPVVASDRVATPGALSVSVGGALASDLVAGGTGLLLPNWSRGEYAWHDRAALMEREWEAEAPLLADPFDPSARGPAGALMLNSTVTGSGCRLVLSQVALPGRDQPPAADAGGRSMAAPDPAAPPAPGPQCLSADHTPVSIDFFDPANGFCGTDVAWSTAAMLSARFPLISPAGRVRYGVAGNAGAPNAGTSCTPAGAFQAIDGGYAEGSGLGTVSDIWGSLRQLVEAHNQAVDDGDSSVPASASYVVPIFVYIRNSLGVDVTAKVPAPIAELAVPLAGLKAKASQVDAEAWLQRLEQSANVCLSPSCEEASNAVLGRLGSGRTVVVAPRSEAAIDPPLGWTLSMLSRARLDNALADERGACGTKASLCRLLSVLSGAAVASR